MESPIYAVKSSSSQQNCSSRNTNKGKQRDQRKDKSPEEMFERRVWRSRIAQLSCKRTDVSQMPRKKSIRQGMPFLWKKCTCCWRKFRFRGRNNVIGTVNKKTNSKNDWNVVFKVGKRDTALKIDSGAQCNVMPYEKYQRLTKGKPVKSKTKLVSYSEHNIKVIAKNTVPREHKRKFYPVELQIAEKSDVVPVLGLQTCLELNLIKRAFAVNDTSDETGIPQTCQHSRPVKK